MQKHQNFDTELQANQARIDDVTKTGQELVDADHYNKDQIRERIDEMHDLWKQLIDQSGRKGKHSWDLLGLFSINFEFPKLSSVILIMIVCVSHTVS